MKAHEIRDDNEADNEQPNGNGRLLARVHPANPWAIEKVLQAPLGTNNGRSVWVWVRLPNGDLILGMFPKGDTYFDVEDDARYPS